MQLPGIARRGGAANTDRTTAKARRVRVPRSPRGRVAVATFAGYRGAGAATSTKICTRAVARPVRRAATDRHCTRATTSATASRAAAVPLATTFRPTAVRVLRAPKSVKPTSMPTSAASVVLATRFAPMAVRLHVLSKKTNTVFFRFRSSLLHLQGSVQLVDARATVRWPTGVCTAQWIPTHVAVTAMRCGQPHQRLPRSRAAIAMPLLRKRSVRLAHRSTRRFARATARACWRSTWPSSIARS